jgi:LysM repeat protein
MKYVWIFLVCGLFTCLPKTKAQSRNPHYINYIEKYHELAVFHMKTYKIPASITLAQGILESGAGKSPFVLRSNNHFGIKCQNEWNGAKVYRDDDVRNECFRKYKKAEDSFEDHSRFLTQRSRYAGLFRLDITAYRLWAKGLSVCGYATDPHYADKLIKLIEDYELYKYDNVKFEHIRAVGLDIVLNGKFRKERDVYKKYGLIYVIAEKDDSFEKVASDMDFTIGDLLKYNEVPKGFPLNKGDIVYLEKKKQKADKPNYDHVVQSGESMHSISQQYGICLHNLYKINRKDAEFIPMKGDVLRLR